MGRSEGAEVVFTLVDEAGRLAEADRRLTVFTTRPDTLFGATYMVLAPEHRLVEQLTSAQWPDDTPELWKGADPLAAKTPATAIACYRAFAASKSDLERTDLAKEKTGVFTGAWAINPVNGQRIPIWIADYVLATYGTGAIMAVPAHDTRDLEFARKYHLPIVQVVQAPEGIESIGYIDDGVSVNSGLITGLPTAEAKTKITKWLEAQGLGRKMINYKLRDWLFSRQRYWGEPFPIIWRNGRHEAVPESDLPVLLPELDDFKPTPTGEPPLARAAGWVNLPDGGQRETNTMPQWAGSCWYYLRYLDAHNDQCLCGRAAETYWMGTSPQGHCPGVDLYVGGTEHAVLHLLYARFWHKVLYDLGHVSTPEPFYKLVNQGLILGETEFTAFYDATGAPCSTTELRDVKEEATPDGPCLTALHGATGQKLIGQRVYDDQVQESGGAFYLKSNPAIRLDARSFKMAKSRGNVINPDTILEDYGADAFRLYEMFMGPLEMVKPWSTKGVEGVYRFLGRVWRLFMDEQSETEFEQALTVNPRQGLELLEQVRLAAAIQEAEPDPSQLKILHACIKKVTEDLEGLRFNTAIAAMMIFVNEAIAWPVKPAAVLRDFLLLLQPFAPHLAEELFAKLTTRFPSLHLGQTPTMAYLPWPQLNPAYLVEDTLELAVQVNGKLRGRIQVPATATREAVEAAALACDKAQPFLAGKTVRKIILVPGRLVNIAVS
jgi:leucyl-tRNA synthetase